MAQQSIWNLFGGLYKGRSGRSGENDRSKFNDVLGSLKIKTVCDLVLRNRALEYKNSAS